MKSVNLIEMELARRDKKSGFKGFASRVAKKTPVVARSIVSGSEKFGRGVVGAVKTVADTYDDVQDYRLRIATKQAQIAKAKSRRDAIKGRASRRSMSFLPADNPFRRG